MMGMGGTGPIGNQGTYVMSPGGGMDVGATMKQQSQSALSSGGSGGGMGGMGGFMGTIGGGLSAMGKHSQGNTSGGMSNIGGAVGGFMNNRSNSNNVQTQMATDPTYNPYDPGY